MTNSPLNDLTTFLHTVADFGLSGAEITPEDAELWRSAIEQLQRDRSEWITECRALAAIINGERNNMRERLDYLKTQLHELWSSGTNLEATPNDE